MLTYGDITLVGLAVDNTEKGPFILRPGIMFWCMGSIVINLLPLVIDNKAVGKGNCLFCAGTLGILLSLWLLFLLGQELGFSNSLKAGYNPVILTGYKFPHNETLALSIVLKLLMPFLGLKG